MFDWIQNYFQFAPDVPNILDNQNILFNIHFIKIKIVLSCMDSINSAN